MDLKFKHRPGCSRFVAMAAAAGVAVTAVVTVALPGCASLAGDEPASVLPFEGSAITLYAAGDIADCRKVSAERSGAARTAAVIASGIAQDPSTLVLALGDTTYPVGLAAEFEHCYAPTWGHFLDRTLPAPGNHEYYTKGAPGYFGYFGKRAGEGTRGYYSREAGPWHIVSLNSNLRPPQSDEQIAWLRDDLARARSSNPQGCVLAFWHHPYYSSGGHGNNAHMRAAWQALLDVHADVVLSAHDHDYERFSPQDASANLDTRNGLRQFVIGNGGAELSPYTATKPHSQAQDNSTHGVLKMLLGKQGYQWAFLPVDGGAARDVGSARCNAGQAG